MKMYLFIHDNKAMQLLHVKIYVKIFKITMFQMDLDLVSS